VFGVSQIHTEIANLAKEAGFQDVGEAVVAELLESHSLSLTNELAGLDKQMYKEALDDDDDDDEEEEEEEEEDDDNNDDDDDVYDNGDSSVISEERILTFTCLGEACRKIIEAVEYFRNMILYLSVVPGLNISCEMCCTARLFCKQKCELESKQHQTHSFHN
jgi:hypothetical protein